MGRNRFLANRTATTWNLLPTTVVNAKSMNNFKAAFFKASIQKKKV
jgi:hypothetical protein